MKKQKYKLITIFLLIAIIVDYNVKLYAVPMSGIAKSIEKAAQRSIKVKPNMEKYVEKASQEAEKASQETEKSTGLFSSCSDKKEEKVIEGVETSGDVLKMLSRCPICNGDGRTYDNRICGACKGTGKRQKLK